VVAWLVSVAGLAVAWLLQTTRRGPLPQGESGQAEHGVPAPQWQQLALATSIAGSVVWIVASLDGLPHLCATLALVLYAWLLFGVDAALEWSPDRAPNSKLHLAPHAVVLVLFAAMKWAWIDGLTDRMSVNWNAGEYIPVLNPFMGMGVLLAASLAIMVWLKQTEFERLLTVTLGRSLSSAAFFFALAILVLVILTIGLSFEADRLVERAAAAGRELVWSVQQLRLFALTILWEMIVLVLAFIGRLSEPRALATGQSTRPVGFQTVLPWILFLVVAAKFMIFDMLMMRLTAVQGAVPVSVFFNLQVLTAMLLLAGFFCLSRLSPLPLPITLPDKSTSTGIFDVENFPIAQFGVDEAVRMLQIVANSAALLILLLAGTLEIDRAFAGPLAASFSDPRFAEEVAISIFWSLFAITGVLAGFRFWNAGLRLFGLSLFGVTVLKVLLIDLREVRFGYRILSLLGLGLLLLATSVVYGKLGAKRLRGGGRS